MFIVSFLVTLVITLMFNPSLIMLKVMVVPLVATICELFSRRGFDNLTIPISSTVIYYLLTFLS
jgi:dolichol kinase